MHWYAERILSHLQPYTLPAFAAEAFDAPERYPYGARSEAAIYVGDLLAEEVPELDPRRGALEMVAIARRPGVLSKVALRPRLGAPETTVPRIGADHLGRVRDRLDGERIQVVAWQRRPQGYIADALGLGEIPPMVLLAGIGHARVYLGEIDLRGIAGWRGLNTLLASALTGWRIRLEPVALTQAWRRLEAAIASRRTIEATVVGPTERGLRVDVLGLFAVLSRYSAPGSAQPEQNIYVRVTRMDADEGRIWVSDRLAATAQLALL